MPLTVLPGFDEGAQMAQAVRRPKLATAFEPPLPLPTRRFHRPGTNRPATLGSRTIIQASGMSGKIVLFPPDDFASLAPTGFQPPPLAQWATPVPFAGVLPVPGPDFNVARPGGQMKSIRVPMDQPPLAFLGKITPGASAYSCSRACSRFLDHSRPSAITSAPIWASDRTDSPGCLLGALALAGLWFISCVRCL